MLNPPTPAIPRDLSVLWQERLKSVLHVQENVLATLVVDLDDQLCYGQGLLVLTSQRFLSWSPSAESSDSNSITSSGWVTFVHQPGGQLVLGDHAGVGHLCLHNGQDQLAKWRFTLGQNLQAIRLVEQFKDQLAQEGQKEGLKDGQSGNRNTHRHTELIVGVCPSCNSPLEPDADECAICAKLMYTPPSTWTLLRLWRFAKPYKVQLIWGFVLTLLGTAASFAAHHSDRTWVHQGLPLLHRGTAVPLQAGDQQQAHKIHAGRAGSPTPRAMRLAMKGRQAKASSSMLITQPIRWAAAAEKLGASPLRRGIAQRM